MIVREPPYELVALFSDLEMQKLIERLIERGQERRNCTRAFRWLSLRDPRRDTVWREPDRALQVFSRSDCRFLIVWDHHGSGSENLPPQVIESQAVSRLTALGIQEDRVLAVAFSPELEIAFRRVWPKVKRVVSDRRGIDAPEDSAILDEARRHLPQLKLSETFEESFVQNPKEVFEALVRLVRLRRSPPLYEGIGDHVSLRALKGESAISRIASAIASWFPPNEP
ncbi:MAG TPA: hypothetical protein VLE27_12070 [Thermoanaerobaculia bacterium]|nr:hypothetical protein [Thermoanaerobaculia bacterium]